MSSRSAWWEGREVWLITGLAMLVFGAGIGLRDPWPADEPVYALIARDMLLKGNWLIPMVGGDYFQDKPPLLFWMQAACYALTGSWRVGFLLPSLLCGVATVLLVYDLGRRLWNREAGLHAALLLLFTVQFTLQSRRAQLDAPLVLFTTLSLYCLMRQLLLAGGWRWAVCAGLAAGLGALSKVVGFLSFLVLLPWLYAVWRRWPRVQWQSPWWMWLLPVVACVAVIGAWLLPIWLKAQQDPAVRSYFQELVFEQTLGRYVDPWHHYRPVWYFIQVMVTLWLPAVLLLPWLIPRWSDALKARDARVLLPLGFVVLYVLLFTLSSGKRDLYILSALPMMALAAGFLLPELLRRRAVQWTLAGFTALIALAALLAWLYLSWIDADRGQQLLRDGGIASLAPLIALAVAAILALVLFGRGRAHLAVAAALIAGWQIFGWWVAPAIDGARSARDFIARLEQISSPDQALGLLAYHEHFLWQLDRPSFNFGHRRFREGDTEMHDAAAWLAAAPGRQLLVPERMMRPCFAGTEQKLVGDSSRGDWYLVTGVPAAECSRRGDASHVFRYEP